MFWSPVVYGRTLKVDFRLLAFPEGMSSESMSWLLSGVAAATRNPYGLRAHGDRMAVFSNGEYVTFGMAGMIISLTNDQSISVQGTRDLYGFLGYCGKLSVLGDQAIPCGHTLSKEWFKSHTELIRRHWDDEPYYQSERRQTAVAAGPLPGDVGLSPCGGDPAQFNPDRKVVKVWSDTTNNRKLLWDAFVDQTWQGKESALYLGLETTRDATALPVGGKHGYLYNCTVHEHQGEPRVLSLLVPSPQPKEKRDQTTEKSEEYHEASKKGRDDMDGHALIGWILLLGSPVAAKVLGLGGAAAMALAGIFFVFEKQVLARGGHKKSRQRLPITPTGPPSLENYGFGKPERKPGRRGSSDWQ